MQYIKCVSNIQHCQSFLLSSANKALKPEISKPAKSKLVIKLFSMMCCLGINAFAVEDPRMAIDEVRICVETAKTYLRSTEYADREKEQDLIGACREADPDCVRAVGESLRSDERSTKENLLPLIRGCHGRNTGKCYRAMIERMASSDYREASQAKKLLKKCE